MNVFVDGWLNATFENVPEKAQLAKQAKEKLDDLRAFINRLPVCSAKLYALNNVDSVQIFTNQAIDKLES